MEWSKFVARWLLRYLYRVRVIGLDSASEWPWPAGCTPEWWDACGGG
jgi:hypothetical protein